MSGYLLIAVLGCECVHFIASLLTSVKLSGNTVAAYPLCVSTPQGVLPNLAQEGGRTHVSAGPSGVVGDIS